MQMLLAGRRRGINLDDACFFVFLCVCVFCKHQKMMMKAVIRTIAEIENVYKEKPLIRNLEYKIGLSLCHAFI